MPATTKYSAKKPNILIQNFRSFFPDKINYTEKTQDCQPVLYIELTIQFFLNQNSAIL